MKDFSLDNSLASSWIASTNYCKGTPSKPLAIDQSFCLNEKANPISATATKGYSLLWFDGSAGGIASKNPPTPSTAIVGTKDYYVSQINQLRCESDRAKITASVIDCSAVKGIILKVSPNPTSSSFSIKNNNIFKIDIQIFNSIGKLLDEVKNIQPQSNVYLGTNYGAGLYYIRASGNSNTTFQKLIRL